MTNTIHNVSDERVLAAYAVLAVEGHDDELLDHDDALDELFERIEKLEAQLPTRPSDVPEPVFVGDLLADLDEDELARAVLAGAIELQSPVEFIYTNGDGETLVRTVSPYELKTVADGRRFVLGWDHQRNGIRQFEVGKFESVVCAAAEVPYRQPVG